MNPQLAIGLSFWFLALLFLVPKVGRRLRRARRIDGPPILWDRDGDPWDRNPDGTYRLRDTNSDRLLQAMDEHDLEQAFGPLTLTAPVENGTQP